VIAASVPAASVLARGDEYWNRRLNLELRKPIGWHYWSTIDFHAAAGQQALRAETPPEAESILRSPDALPFVAIARKPAADPGFSSSIVAYDEERDGSYPPAMECLDMAIAAYSKYLSGAAVVEAAGQARIAGADDAARARWVFDFEIVDGTSCPVKAFTLLAYRSGRMQTFHFMALGEGSAQDERALAQSAASVRYLDAGYHGMRS
jgi:hypothetical protein